MVASAQASRVTPTERFYVLDGIRGVGAFLVMFGHYLDPGHGQNPFLSITHVAVDMFFILSGFVVYHAYAGKLQNGMTAGAYINRRFSRFAPTVTAGVIFGAIGLAAWYAAYDLKMDPVRFALVHIGHLAFIPAFVDFNVPATELGHLFPSNRSLWSIFYEFVATVCFLWFLKLRQWALFVGAVASYVVLVLGCYAVAQDTGADMTTHVGGQADSFFLGFPRVFGDFLSGMLLYRITYLKPGWFMRFVPAMRGIIPALAVYVALLVFFLFPYRWNGTYQVFSLVILSPLLIIVGVRVSPDRKWVCSSMDWLGQLSFPLYCIHEPMRLLVESTFVANDLTSVPWSYRVLLSMVLSTLFAAFLLEVFRRLSAEWRVGKWLKPITG